MARFRVSKAFDKSRKTETGIFPSSRCLNKHWTLCLLWHAVNSSSDGANALKFCHSSTLDTFKIQVPLFYIIYHMRHWLQCQPVDLSLLLKAFSRPLWQCLRSFCRMVKMSTVRCRHNTVIFLKNAHNIRHIAHLWGQIVGSLLRVQTLVHVMPCHCSSVCKITIC